MLTIREAVTVDDLHAQADDLDDEAVHRSLSLLEELHARVLSLIASRPDVGASDLLPLKREIERLMGQFAVRLGATVMGYQQQAFDLSDELVDLQLTRAGISLGIVGISDAVLRVAQAYVPSQITDITTTAASKIGREIQLAALGGRSYTELTKAIGANLDGPSVFGTLAVRTEVITRTETAKVRALGYQQRGNQAAELLPGLKKVWRHAPQMTGGGKKGTYQPRPAHVALHGRTIAWEEQFSVNGYPANGPHDPNLPAKEVVNCKCRLVLDVSGTEYAT